MTDKKGFFSKENLQYIYPLTAAQQGLLFHVLLEPESGGYFVQSLYQISGNFDGDRCQETWNILMQRHELLRSSIIHKNQEQPIQVVLKERPLDFLVDDLRHLPEQEQQIVIEEFCHDDRRRGFDLRKDPLFRIRSFQKQDFLFVMLWSYSHLLLDGWSGGILLTEFAEIYASLRNHTKESLPELISYNQYWDYVEKRDPIKSLAIWQNYLEGYEDIASVPRLNKNLPLSNSGSLIHSFILSRKTSDALRKIAQQNAVTLNTILKCIWGVVLALYNNRNDVVFGTVTAGRPPKVPGIENLVGMFINTIPVRIHFNENTRFSDLMKQSQNESWDLEPFQDISLAELQSPSGEHRDLFDHLFVFENYPSSIPLSKEEAETRLGFSVESAQTFEQAHYLFGIVIFPGEQIEINLHYTPSAFLIDELVRMEGHLQTVIEQVIHHPERQITDIELLTTIEKQQVLNFSKGIKIPFPDQDTIHGLWEKQVEQNPDHLAVIVGRKHFTYSEINQKVNQLADYLRGYRHLGKGEFVAVFLPPCEWRVIALLGILKAGGVYVPIDPSYPSERIQWILNDSQCRFVLTLHDGMDFFLSLSSITAVNLSSLPSCQTGNSISDAIATDLAYVIYTSGSTGVPKGVLIEHRGFLNMIYDQIRTFGIVSKDRVLQLASSAFDASLSEMGMALLTGATVVFIDKETLLDSNQFLRYVEENRVSVVTFPPSFLSSFEHCCFPAVRVIISAGEAVNEQDARHYCKSLHFYNAYGPTENSVCSTIQYVSPQEEYPYGIPIGKPISNTSIRILDSHLHCVPIGVQGEMYLTGTSLARGYHDREELSREKFIKSPFPEDGRMYKTGDLGRWLPDGSIDYIGRIDSQVKINGYRIELGEIESVLLRHPSIREAAVLFHKKEKILLAFYILRNPLCVEDLKAFLSRSLPPYMLPSDFIPLDKIPLTSNGKIDTSVLLHIFSQQQGNRSVPVRPGNVEEEQIVMIWEEVLGRDNIGIHDSFFDLGGNSLKAIQLINRLRKQGFHFTLKNLYTARTVFHLLQQKSIEENWNLPTTDFTEAPLTPVQHWFFTRPEEQWSPCNHIYTLRSKKRVDGLALQTSLSHLYKHHDVLQLCFKRDNNGHIRQVIDNESSGITLQVVESQEESSSTFRQWIEKDYCHFDITCAPLMKAILFKFPNEDVLCIIAHHLVTDAVSWGFFLEDIVAAYYQVMQNLPVSLPPKTDSYLQWAHALDVYARQESILHEIPYWRHIEEASSGKLPDGSICDNNTYGKTKRVEIILSPLETHHLKDCIRAYPSLDIVDVLLYALSHALKTCMDGNLVRITITGHGRREIKEGINVSRSAGWFTAYYPFLLPLGGDIRDIRKKRLQVPGGGLGYGILKYLSPYWENGNNNFSQKPEINFNYLGEMDTVSQNDVFVIDENLTFVSISHSFQRENLLEIEGMIVNEELRFGFNYNPSIHEDKTINHISETFLTNLLAFDYVFCNDK